MPNFVYEAINERGSMVSGVIPADSLDSAERALMARGLIPAKVSEEVAASAAGWRRGLLPLMQGVKAADLILFTKQLRSMFQAGVPVMRLLQVLGEQTENPTLKAAIASVGRDIREGLSLSDAVRKHPRVFSPLYCSMIHAGEESGTLPQVLQRLIYIMEHEAKVKTDIKSALQYPMIVVCALVVAFIVLLTFVVPKFASLFSRAGLELPLPTRMAVTLYQVVAHYWPAGVAVILLLIFGFHSWFKTEQGRYVRDAVILRLPLVGPVFIKAIMSRFASIFAILQSSGLAVVNTIDILSGTIGNAAVSRQFDQISRQMREGHGIANPLKGAKYFTPMVIDMVAIGEESGNLDEMLMAIAKHYDEEVEYAVKRLSDAIGPILIVGLAMVVGFFALAIFMPMWDLTKVRI